MQILVLIQFYIFFGGIGKMTEAVIKPAKNKSSSRTWKNIVKYKYIYLFFLLPAVVWFFIFCYVPMYGILMAFKDYNFGLGVMRSPWVGLRYFTDFITDIDFYHIIRNTLCISLLKLIFGFPAPIILALMLNSVINTKFKKVIQTVSYLPYFVSWVVVVTLMSTFLSPTNGIINDIRNQMGLSSIYFMGKPALFYPLVVLSDIWKNVGWGSIIYLAALTNVDPTLYEAADIDGAGRWARLWKITIPCIKPTIGILFIMSLGGLFRAGYEQIYLMQNPSVLNVSEILDTYVLKKGILQGQFGYSTAVGLFQSVISLGIVLLGNYLCKKATDVALF